MDIKLCLNKAKKLCLREECTVCKSRSFATSPFAHLFSKKNNIDIKLVFISSKIKYIFDCDICNHEYIVAPNTLTTSGNKNCPYCTNVKLCHNNDCLLCFNKSFAKSPYVSLWSLKNNILPRYVFISTNKQFIFNCNICKHEYKTKLNSIAATKTNHCSYCASLKFCDDKNCLFCFNKSFASSEFAHTWNKNNNISPRYVSKSSSACKYLFDCSKCLHTYETSLSNMTSKGTSGCPFCANRNFCNDDTCLRCFNNSFASIKFSELWSEKNTISPRYVSKYNENKYWFNCNICFHNYDTTLCNISSTDNSRCPYCVSLKLCNDDNCLFCFNKSFASSKFAKCFSNDNKVIPRMITKRTARKYKFNCNKCKKSYETRPDSIANRGSNGCPFCVNKTETMLMDELVEYFNIKRQFRPLWARKSNIRYSYIYDFVIENLKIIIELDGEQHHKQTWNWMSPEENQMNDKIKMKLASDNNYSVIRISRQIIVKDLNYLTTLLNEINDIKKLNNENLTPVYTYIGLDNEYDNFY